MPKPAGDSSAATSQAASPAAAANEELQSILYPQAGGTATASTDDAGEDFDPEFDDPNEGNDTGTDPEDAEEGEDGQDGEDAESSESPESSTEDAEGKDDGQDPEEGEDGEDPESAESSESSDDDEKALRAKAKFSPDQQKVVDKLLGRKTEQVRAARTEKQKLESQVKALSEANDQLKAGLPAPVPTRENPLADATTEADLQARERNAVSLRYWLMRNRDGGELPDGKGGKTTISPERRDELLAETDELLMVHLPARRQFVQQQRQFDVEARRAFPDLADPKSELSLRVDAALRHYPALQSMPEARLFLADALANRDARTKGASAAAIAARKAAAAAPGAKGQNQSRKAPRTEGAPRVAARVNPGRKHAEQALTRLAATGRDEGNVALAQLIGGRR